MNIKLHINKLNIFTFLILFIFFSCNNEKEVKKEVLVPAFEFKINSLNASEFAKSFVEDIYNMDTVSARNKIHIEYECDSFCVTELLAINEVFSELDLFTQLNKQILMGADLNYLNFENYFNSKVIWLGLFTAPKEINYYRLNLTVINNQIVISEYRSFMRGASCNEMMEELVNLVCVKKTLNLNKVKQGLKLMDSTVNTFYNLNSEEATLFFSKIDLIMRETKVIQAKRYNLDFHSNSEIRVKALVKSEYTKSKGIFTPWKWFNHFYINMENENYSEARDAFIGLRFAVGDDPILIYLEATTYFEEYNYTKALDLYNKALSKEPTIPNFHFAKVICLIEMGEYIQAVESLLIMEDYFDVENTNWDKEFMAYPKFLMSDEYSRLLERIDASGMEPT